MSGQTAAHNISDEIILTVLSGPEMGVAYKLLGQTITLGRSTENDVVLQDNKSSRNHAQIERREDGYWIKDLQSTAGVLLNGLLVKEALLNLGDEITVGNTLLRFGPAQGLSLITTVPPVPGETDSPPPLPHLPLTKNMNLSSDVVPVQASHPMRTSMPLTGALAGNPIGPMSMSGAPKRHNSQKKNYLPMLVIAVLVIGALSMWKGHAAHKSGFKIKDEAAYEEQIAATSESNDQRAQEIAKSGKDTQQYAEAQAFYMRGFREFREGNYNRAIQGFQAALSIYPNHPLAKRYLETARIKNNQLTTEALERGEKDFQLEKYNMAKNEYRSVMLLSGDRNNKSFQLAEKRLETIELILQSNK